MFPREGFGKFPRKLLDVFFAKVFGRLRKQFCLIFSIFKDVCAFWSCSVIMFEEGFGERFLEVFVKGCINRCCEFFSDAMRAFVRVF